MSEIEHKKSTYLLTVWILLGLFDSAPANDGIDRQPVYQSIVRPHALEELSELFCNQFDEAARSIPDEIWIGLRQGGWQIRTCKLLVDVVPSLAGEQPRGWPDKSSWENTDAVYLPKLRLLVVAEKRKSTSGDSVTSQRVAGTLRHELGHAFDSLSARRQPYRSSETGFLTAYESDVNQIRSSDHPTLRYYLQKGQAGRQEAFAEAFGILLGGGSDLQMHNRFVEQFPNAMNYVDAAIKQYRAVPRRSSRAHLPATRGRILRRS